MIRTRARHERIIGMHRACGPCRYTLRMAKLYFYYSAMNAGKTTTLLQSAHNYRERGMRVAILTPRLDDRAGSGTVASRIGLQRRRHRLRSRRRSGGMVRADIAAHGPLDCVLVDEAQFLSRAQVWQLSEVVDALRIPVLCYGLRTDFRGELFEGSQYLLAWADELIEIKTICHSGKKATMIVRVDAQGRAVQDGPQVEIGGNDRYVSVSRARSSRRSCAAKARSSRCSRRCRWSSARLARCPCSSDASRSSIAPSGAPRLPACSGRLASRRGTPPRSPRPRAPSRRLPAAPLQLACMSASRPPAPACAPGRGSATAAA